MDTRDKATHTRDGIKVIAYPSTTNGGHISIQYLEGALVGKFEMVKLSSLKPIGSQYAQGI